MRALTLFARFVAVLLVGAIATSLAVAAITPRLRDLVQANDAESSVVKVDELANNSFVFAADETYIGTLHGPQNRELIKLADISTKTVNAILAVEDADFFTHNGVNARSIIRALISNVNAGAVTQGGSTITQQLVKNLVLDDNRQQFDRKIPEAAIALRLEDQMTKEEILELYLNTVYFGAGAYGVKTAAEVYFAKSAKDLDWPESALLASLISSPSNLDPTRNPEGAQRQRRLALRSIEGEGYITEAQRKEYEQAPLPAVRNQPQSSLDNLEDGYFLEEVKQQLLKMPALEVLMRLCVYQGGLPQGAPTSPALSNLVKSQARCRAGRTGQHARRPLHAVLRRPGVLVERRRRTGRLSPAGRGSLGPVRLSDPAAEELAAGSRCGPAGDHRRGDRGSAQVALA